MAGIAAPALTVLVAVFTVSACASNPENASPDSMLTGAVFSVNCEWGWSDCYREAQRRCPSGRFDEIDRAAIEQTYNDRNDARMANLQGEPVNRSIVVRCE